MRSRFVWRTATFELLTSAAENFARTSAAGGERVFHVGHDALQKWDAGIAFGTSFRRLVAKTFAHQFAQEVEAGARLFQFAHRLRGPWRASCNRGQPASNGVVYQWGRSLRPRAPQPWWPNSWRFPVCRVYFHSCSTTFTSTKEQGDSSSVKHALVEVWEGCSPLSCVSQCPGFV